LTIEVVSAVVVNKVEVAHRVVNDVEADVGAHLVRVRVVLDERIEEEAEGKSVKQARADETS
jgi:hypothetical protein